MKRKKTAYIVIAIVVILSIALTISKGDLSKIENIEELGKKLSFLTFVPTILAVSLAFLTHNVLFSLSVGFLSGILVLSIATSTSIIRVPLVFLSQTLTSVKNVLLDLENIEILLLCVIVGGMVEVVRSSGGFEALALKLTRRINTPRKAGLITSLLGCIIFFDDYANALIVGPIMRPITDRVKVSREKLSYIVDSTAAPVTGIAIVSSWVAVEIASIEKGLTIAGSNMSGFSLFINSVPYTFYCLFCLSFIFLNSLLERDFGPMLKAEKRARNGEPVSNESKKLTTNEKTIVSDKFGQRIFVGVGSIVSLVLFAMISFYVSGRSIAISEGALLANAPFNLQTIMTAFSYADTIKLVSIASIVGSAFALIFGYLFKLFNLKDGLKAWLNGAKGLLPTLLMLLSAWCLADIISRLGTTFYAIEIISSNVPEMFVPILIFVTCCVISFTSGSFGCLFVVMPLAVPLAFKMISMNPSINNNVYLLLCIGAVMAGSIFGDHCSPVTDCTILSAIGSGCTTMEHCRTQLPYAFICAGVAIVFGILLTYLGLNVFVSLLIGVLSQVIILFVFGKKPI